MASRGAFAVVCALALTLPFQALTAMYLDVRGPAHVHVDSADDDHDHPHDHGHEHSHSHARNGIEHHHHHPHDHTVVAVHEHGVPDSPFLEEETRSGWSGSMFAALVGSTIRREPPKVSRAARPPRELPPPIPFLERLERPPRIART